jgi:hypothetical protein
MAVDVFTPARRSTVLGAARPRHRLGSCLSAWALKPLASSCSALWRPLQCTFATALGSSQVQRNAPLRKHGARASDLYSARGCRAVHVRRLWASRMGVRHRIPVWATLDADRRLRAAVVAVVGDFFGPAFRRSQHGSRAGALSETSFSLALCAQAVPQVATRAPRDSLRPKKTLLTPIRRCVADSAQTQSLSQTCFSALNVEA